VLHHAALDNSNLDVYKYIVSQGLDVNVKQNNGITALHTAAGNNPNVEALKCLISIGADVNAKVGNGLTPLDLADTEEKKQILREAMQRR